MPEYGPASDIPVPDEDQGLGGTGDEDLGEVGVPGDRVDRHVVGAVGGEVPGASRLQAGPVGRAGGGVPAEGVAELGKSSQKNPLTFGHFPKVALPPPPVLDILGVTLV